MSFVTAGDSEICVDRPASVSRGNGKFHCATTPRCVSIQQSSRFETQSCDAHRFTMLTWTVSDDELTLPNFELLGHVAARCHCLHSKRKNNRAVGCLG